MEFMGQMRRMHKKNIIAMIPAKLGSTRLAMKNLALINGKPLIYYPIKVAQMSGIFDRVVINAEDDVFAKIAKRYGVEFYRRPMDLAGSTARSDSVVYDFMKNVSSDIVVWINTIAPLQTATEVIGAVNHFTKERLDSMVTVKNEQVHCIYKGKPVNFKVRGLFTRTQDLIPVQSVVYSIMMWRSEVFVREFEKMGYAFFCGKTGVYPVSKLSAIIIKRREDLMLADAIMRTRNGKHEVKYDTIIKV